MHVREETPTRPAAFPQPHRDDVDHIDITADDPTVMSGHGMFLDGSLHVDDRHHRLMAKWRLAGRG